MRNFLLGSVAVAAMALPLTAQAGFISEDFSSQSGVAQFSFPVFGTGTVTRGTDGNKGSGLSIFDSTATSGPDGDLRPSTAGLTSTFGNLLVLQEQNTPLADDDAQGGILNFILPSALSLHSMTFLDIEGGESIVFRDGADATGSVLGTVNGSAGETSNTFQSAAVVTIDFITGSISNASGTIDTAAFSGLTEFSIDLRNTPSTGISEISAVPLPGALVLFGAGAAVVGLVARRRRQPEAAAT